MNVSLNRKPRYRLLGITRNVLPLIDGLARVVNIHLSVHSGRIVGMGAGVVDTGVVGAGVVVGSVSVSGSGNP